MKKGFVVGLMMVFSVFAAGPAFAAIGADGNLTMDKPAAKWPAKKLNADGTKKKNPVTFNHTKHGELGCQTCHHSDKELKTGGTPAKLCFDCHGPAPDAANAKQLDTYEMIHGKTAMCIACHKTDEKAKAAKAPTSCKACHGGADE